MDAHRTSQNVMDDAAIPIFTMPFSPLSDVLEALFEKIVATSEIRNRVAPTGLE
jgi:hypothetical protein